MKAVIFQDIHKFDYTEIPEPTCPSGWVKIKVQAVGLCATEMHMLDGTFFGGNPPHVLGHEICGDIVEVGDGVTPDRIGRRVVVETYVGCGECEFCRSGRKHLCSAGEIGYPPYNGGDAQYVVVPLGCVRYLTDRISYDEGAIMEAVACPFGAVLQCELKEKQTVLVLGSGVAGLSFVQSVKALSPESRVFCTVRNDVKAEFVRKMGGEVIDLRKEDAVERIMRETDRLGADLVIEALGSADSVAQCFAAVKSGGRVMLYGIPDQNEKITLPVIDCILRQITVCGYTGNEKGWDPLIRLVDEGKIDLKSMISAVFPLSRYGDAVELYHQHHPETIKIVLHPWE